MPRRESSGRSAASVPGDVTGVAGPAPRASRAPWCPLVLVIRNVPVSAILIEQLTHLHGPLAFVKNPVGKTVPGVEEILEAVRSRGGPNAEEAFSYAANRLGLASLRSLFTEADAFAAPSNSKHKSPPPRPISRQLRALGSLGVPRLEMVVPVGATIGSWADARRGAGSASRRGSRTFRIQVRRYTGVSTRNFATGLDGSGCWRRRCAGGATWTKRSLVRLLMGRDRIRLN